jgi:hypothetical protein
MLLNPQNLERRSIVRWLIQRSRIIRDRILIECKEDLQKKVNLCVNSEG